MSSSVGMGILSVMASS